MGRRHARVFAALSDRFELVGAYDPRTGLEWPEGLPVLGGEREALARADVVVVATPTRTHAGIVARALAAGRHVLVEKPLCARAAEAEALGAVASRGAGAPLRRSFGALQPGRARAGQAGPRRAGGRHRHRSASAPRGQASAGCSSTWAFTISISRPTSAGGRRSSTARSAAAPRRSGRRRGPCPPHHDVGRLRPPLRRSHAPSNGAAPRADHVTLDLRGRSARPPPGRPRATARTVRAHGDAASPRGASGRHRPSPSPTRSTARRPASWPRASTGRARWPSPSARRAIALSRRNPALSSAEKLSLFAPP